MIEQLFDFYSAPLLLCDVLACGSSDLSCKHLQRLQNPQMPGPHIGGEKSAGEGDFRTQKGNGGVSDVQLWGQVGWARGGTMGWVAP